MDNIDQTQEPGVLPREEELPFAAPCSQLPLTAPLHWMQLGWRDFKAAPAVSIAYGGVLVLVSYALTFLSWQLGGAILLFSLLSGLVFVAPVLALGLYSVSCQLEEGEKPRLAYCMREGKRHLGNELVFSFVLLIVFLVWVRAGSGLHVFFPIEANPEISELLVFYGIGSVVGAIFASIVFCASAFSLPMMMDRKADAITAVITSVNAVLQNKAPMILWAAIIVACILASFLTAFLGLAIFMPLLGYATWHGYRQTIDASMWRKNKKLSDHYPGQ